MNAFETTNGPEAEESTMKTPRMAAAALTFAAALSLTACQDEQAATTKGSASSPTSSASTATESSPTSSSSSAAETSASSAPPSASAGSDAAAAGPTGARPEAPEKVTPPAGSVLTNASVVMAGGYKSEPSSQYAKLYSVWKIDGTGPGVATIQYEMLDGDNKVLATAESSINVGKGRQMTKVDNGLSKAPAGSVKVRMRITKVEPNPHADDIAVSDVKVIPDGYEGFRPRITGKYAAGPESQVYGFNAVCYERASGRVVVGNGMADDGGAKSGTFTLDLGAAPSHWHPTQCFVGQSGSGA